MSGFVWLGDVPQCLHWHMLATLGYPVGTAKGKLDTTCISILKADSGARVDQIHRLPCGVVNAWSSLRRV